jgi:methionine biosynthesis protein MetW
MLYDKHVKEKALKHLAEFGPAPTHVKIAELTPPDCDVLELGCATGYVSKLLKQKGCRVTGIELDEDAAREAEQYCVHVYPGDIHQLLSAGTLKGRFDCILCGDVLEHLPDPESVLRHLHGLLKSNGFILVSIPNIAFWKMRWDLLTGRFEYQDTGLLDKTHLRFYTIRTFHDLVRDCQFRIDGFWINDAGFPGSILLSRIPFLKRIIGTFSRKLATILPNLFAFHSIFRIYPLETREAGKGSIDG